jgi:hypothetical protein
MKTNNVDKCFICDKEIQRNSIPRIEPELNIIELEDGKEHPICDTCGNLLAIVLRMYKG